MLSKIINFYWFYVFLRSLRLKSRQGHNLLLSFMLESVTLMLSISDNNSAQDH